MTLHADDGRRSFGEVAALYDRVRFDPPDAALEWGLTGAERDVLDLAAGTGQISRRLLAGGSVYRTRKPTLTAVEPDPRMRAVMATHGGQETIRAGTAEAIPAADASFDAVIVASAWHWFDGAAALAEIARVLRDGARLLVMATTFDTTIEWVRSLYTPDMLERQEANRRHYLDVTLPPTLFGDPVLAEFHDRQPTPVEQVVEIFTTGSFYRAADRATRNGIVERVRGTLERRLSGAEQLDVPLRTLAWQADRANSAPRP